MLMLMLLVVVGELLRLALVLLDGVAHRGADGARHIFAAMVVRQDHPAREAVGHRTPFVLARADMRPQLLDAGAEARHWARVVCMRARVRMPQQEKSLLLLPQHLRAPIPVADLSCGRAPSIGAYGRLIGSTTSVTHGASRQRILAVERAPKRIQLISMTRGRTAHGTRPRRLVAHNRGRQRRCRPNRLWRLRPRRPLLGPLLLR